MLIVWGRDVLYDRFLGQQLGWLSGKVKIVE